MTSAADFKTEANSHLALAQALIEDVEARSVRVTKAFETFESKKAAALRACEAARALALEALAATDQATFVGLLGNIKQKFSDTEKAYADFKEAAGTLSAAPQYGEPKAEWEECRKSIDRFDKILVDLRKTAFGIITTIFSVAAFLFTLTTTSVTVPPRIKVAIFVVICLLIISTYCVDRVHQIWLVVAVNRATALEKKLGYSITQDISGRFSTIHAGGIWTGLYVILLFMGWVIFFISINEKFDGGHQITLHSVLVASGAIVVVSGAFPWFKKRYFSLPKWVRFLMIVLAVLTALTLLMLRLAGKI